MATAVRSVRCVEFFLASAAFCSRCTAASRFCLESRAQVSEFFFGDAVSEAGGTGLEGITQMV